MDFSNLLKTVQDFWNFLWPPIICLLLLVGLSWVLATDTSHSVVVWALSLNPRLSDSSALARTLKSMGLSKLKPLVAAFCLVFLLNLTDVVVMTVGNLLPPILVCRTDLLLLAHSDDERFDCLWSRFPDATRMSYLRVDLMWAVDQEEHQDRNSPAVENIHYWEEEGAKAARGFYACKFFILFCAACGLVEVIYARRFWKPVIRAVACAAVLAVVGCLFLAKQLYSIDQAEFGRVDAAMSYLVHGGSTCGSISADETAKFAQLKDQTRAEADGYEHWWRLRPFDEGYAVWFRKQLSP